MNRLFALVLLSVVLTTLMAPFLKAPSPDSVEADTASTQSSTQRSASRRGMKDAYSASTTVLQRDSSGQFHVTAAVNGQDARFLVDTGADVVALTRDEAESLGIELTEDDFLPMMRTASGVGYGAPVMLDRIEIGSAEFRNVEAVVVDGLGTNLLGQSVLRRLGKVELQGDRMVLRHD